MYISIIIVVECWWKSYPWLPEVLAGTGHRDGYLWDGYSVR